MRCLAPLVAAILLLALADAPARAMHQRVYPLREVVADASAVLTGRVAALDGDDLRAVFVIDEALKGRRPWRWMSVDLAAGGWDHPRIVARRLAPGLPLVLFVGKAREQHLALVYTNGTWFRVTAPPGRRADLLPWELTHIELYLPRTYRGPTEEMVGLLRRATAGREEYPEPSQESSQSMQRGGFRALPTVGPAVPAGYRPSRPLPPLPPHLQERPAAPIVCYEAETLRILGSTFTQAQPFWQIPQYDGRDFNFRSAAALLVCRAGPGERLSLRIEAPRAGIYDLHVVLGRVVNTRSLGASLNGRRLSGVRPVDLPLDTTLDADDSGLGGIGNGGWDGGSRGPDDRPATPMMSDRGGKPVRVVYPGVRLARGKHRLELAPEPYEPGEEMRLSLDLVALCPAGGISLTPGDRRALADLKLSLRGERRLLNLAREFYKTPLQVGEALREAGGSWKDARWALKLERTFGRGGPRALVRGPAYFLRLKRSEPWLTWRDLEGVLQRGGEVYHPTRDGNELILRMVRRFSWDEIDPLVLQTKFQGASLERWEAEETAARRPGPLADGEKPRRVHGWSAAEGLDAWRPLRERDAAPLPPRAGRALAAASADVPHLSARLPGKGFGDGRAAWFAYRGAGADGTGAPTRAYLFDRGLPRIEAPASYLLEFDVFVPNHVDEMMLVRQGVFYTKKSSRGVDVGVQATDPATKLPVESSRARLRVEPLLDRPVTLRLRLDVVEEGGRWRGYATAHRDGGLEVTRAAVDLGPSGSRPFLSPVFSLDRVEEGYAPEAYLAAVRVLKVEAAVPFRFASAHEGGYASGGFGGPRAAAGVFPLEEPSRRRSPMVFLLKGVAVVWVGALLGAWLVRRRQSRREPWS